MTSIYIDMEYRIRLGDGSLIPIQINKSENLQIR